jgi:hypothetical protein
VYCEWPSGGFLQLVDLISHVCFCRVRVLCFLFLFFFVLFLHFCLISKSICNIEEAGCVSWVAICAG